MVTTETYDKVREHIDQMRGTEQARCTCTCHVTNECQVAKAEAPSK